MSTPVKTALGGAPVLQPEPGLNGLVLPAKPGTTPAPAPGAGLASAGVFADMIKMTMRVEFGLTGMEIQNAKKTKQVAGLMLALATPDGMLNGRIDRS